MQRTCRNLEMSPKVLNLLSRAIGGLEVDELHERPGCVVPQPSFLKTIITHNNLEWNGEYISRKHYWAVPKR